MKSTRQTEQSAEEAERARPAKPLSCLRSGKAEHRLEQVQHDGEDNIQHQKADEKADDVDACLQNRLADVIGDGGQPRRGVYVVLQIHAQQRVQRCGQVHLLQNAVDALAGERRDVRDSGFKVADAAGRIRVVQEHVKKRLVGLHGGGKLWADQKDARNDISPHPMFSTLAMKPRYSPNSTEMPMMPMMT